MTQAHLPPKSADVALNDEELARGEIYGLLSLLYYAPPTRELWDSLAHAVTQAPQAGAYLEQSWTEVVHAARQHSHSAICDEYEALFGGVGKPEVYLYGSHYLSGFLNEKPLARLRADLNALGLARDVASMPETEDHIAYLFEVMRYLIAAELGWAPSSLAQQKAFFMAHVQPWVLTLCDALAAHPRANFFAAVSGFTRAFMQIESQGFDLVE